MLRHIFLPDVKLIDNEKVFDTENTAELLAPKKTTHKGRQHRALRYSKATMFIIF